jgi:TIGR03943 family protein
MATAYAMPAATIDDASINRQTIVLPEQKSDNFINSVNKQNSSKISSQTDAESMSETGGLTDGTDEYGTQTIVEPTAPVQNDTTYAPQADKNGIINVADNDYVQWYMDVNSNPEKYENKTIRVKGQVLHMDDFAKDEFVPVRMNMVCCVADLEPIGFLCKYKDAQKWADNTWVYVTAKIDIGEYNGEKMPMLYADDVTKAEKPKEEYVYFPF